MRFLSIPMRTIKVRWLVTLAIVVTLAASCRQLLADEHQPGQGRSMEHQLSGRSIDLQRAADDADMIVIGRFQTPGMEDAGGPGQAFWSDAEVEVDAWLRPNVADRRHLTVSYTVQRLPPTVAEQTPRLGQPYILFVVDTRGALRAMKILEANEASERAARTMLGHRP
jgi:hypothetical protein